MACKLKKWADLQRKEGFYPSELVVQDGLVVRQTGGHVSPLLWGGHPLPVGNDLGQDQVPRPFVLQRLHGPQHPLCRAKWFFGTYFLFCFSPIFGFWIGGAVLVC